MLRTLEMCHYGPFCDASGMGLLEFVLTSNKKVFDHFELSDAVFLIVESDIINYTSRENLYPIHTDMGIKLNQSSDILQNSQNRPTGDR